MARSRLLWWNDPTDPSTRPTTGSRMLRNVLIWLVIVIAVIAIGVIASS